MTDELIESAHYGSRTCVILPSCAYLIVTDSNGTPDTRC